MKYADVLHCVKRRRLNATLPGDFPVSFEDVSGRFPRFPDVLPDPEGEGRPLDFHPVQVDVDPVLPLRLRRERHLKSDKSFQIWAVVLAQR